MEEKKQVKISLGTAICIFIIVILLIAIVVLGLYTLKLKNADNENKVTTESNNNLDETQKNPNLEKIDENSSTYSDTDKNESESVEVSSSLNSNSNSNSNSTSNKTTEKIEEINLNDSLVKTLQKKINFMDDSKAAIYKQGKFDLNTIPNDLILKLGWDHTDYNKKELIDENSKQTLSREILEESIKDIFGPNIKYKDESFNYITSRVFMDITSNTTRIDYSNNTYTADYGEGGGGDRPFIHEEIQKVLKYDNKVDVYVKTVFVDIDSYLEDTFEFVYKLYKDFNFNTNDFELLADKMTDTQFFNDFSKGSEDRKINIKYDDKIMSKFNTYVYTFELNSATGEYYLTGFYSIK